MARPQPTPPRELEGIPVEDADGALIIVVIDQDIEGAVPRDPSSCAIARAAGRIAGLEGRAIILRSTAYVLVYNEDGCLRWKRFRLSPKARRIVAHFDDTGEFPKAGVRLLAPTGRHTLDRGAERERERVARRRREGVPRTRRVLPATEGLELTAGVRNGAGQIHFTRT